VIGLEAGIEGVNMGMTKNLVIGKVYAIGHKRKGDFRAQLIDIVPGDAQDPQLLTFKIDTRPGSGQERLARSKGASITVTNVRPSLVVRIDEMPGNDEWLLSQRVAEERRKRADAEKEAQQVEVGQKRFSKIMAMIAE